MGEWFKFGILWAITGNPVIAALIMLVLWGLADWYTFGFVRRVLRFIRNLQRVSRLSQVVQINPHDRKARSDLGDTLIELKRYDRAVAVLKPVLDADPDDVFALYLLGIACLGAGKVEQGELFLNSVLETDPDFRRGQPQLELGRYRLSRGDGKGAAEALGEYLARYASSVEGHYLFSRALQLQGDLAGAAQARQRAWSEYSTALPFQRRVERLWAWRARPSRPAVYAGIMCLCLLGASLALKDLHLARWAASQAEVLFHRYKILPLRATRPDHASSAGIDLALDRSEKTVDLVRYGRLKGAR
jgi:tetratricopeptide (TPR) repeat protein